MRECLNCGKKSLIWKNDFDFEDYGYEGNGTISVYHCANCGAEVTCACPNEYLKQCYKEKN